MGAYLDKFNEVEDGTDQCTPTKISKLLHQKRLLALDPRSPSEGITRTPIIVEKTPLPTNGRAKQYAANENTPVISRNSDYNIDPRSPTNQFTRTPITAGMLPASRRLSPLAVEFNSPSSPISVHNDSESGIESAEVTPVLNLRKNLEVDVSAELHSPDSALSFDSDFHQAEMKHHEDEHDVEEADTDYSMYVDADDSEMESSEVISNLSFDNVISPDIAAEMFPSSDTPKSAVAVVKSKSSVEFTTPKLSVTAHSHLARKTGALLWSQGVTRSPLSSVDNSIQLNQRKNATPGGGRQLVKYSGFVDKENVYH
ncbi:hypothetical protein Btru_071877 [Bulinus truncatus]|nr:hypothetical protein Btru_071877 [Bulinus truncatus]